MNRTYPTVARRLHPSSSAVVRHDSGMDRASAVALYRRGADLFNERKWDEWQATWAPDVRFWSPVLETVGVSEVRAAYERMVNAVPDLRITVRSVHWDEENATVIGEQAEAGTNTGAFISSMGTLPPTGGPFEMHNVLVIKLDDDGRAIEVREYFDVLNVMRQLGAF